MFISTHHAVNPPPNMFNDRFLLSLSSYVPVVLSSALVKSGAKL